MEIKGLYKLNREHEEALIQTFISAFHTYPKLDPAFPDPKAKAAALEATLRFYTAYDMEYGQAFSLDENINEGVCIVHSDDMNYTEERYQKAGCYSPGYQRAVGQLTIEQRKKRDDLFDQLDQLEQTVDLPYPHLYVDFLGVGEPFQHQGRGRRLMSAVCHYAREQQLPLMLFTNTREDVDFYKSLGFHVAGVVTSEKFGFTNTYLVKDV